MVPGVQAFQPYRPFRPFTRTYTALVRLRYPRPLEVSPSNAPTRPVRLHHRADAIAGIAYAGVTQVVRFRAPLG